MLSFWNDQNVQKVLWLVEAHIHGKPWLLETTHHPQDKRLSKFQTTNQHYIFLRYTSLPYVFSWMMSYCVPISAPSRFYNRNWRIKCITIRFWLSALLSLTIYKILPVNRFNPRRSFSRLHSMGRTYCALFVPWVHGCPNVCRQN